eukprot:scaffold6768_cov109-Cylindrotheca_fusiformis.AAC.7
MTATASDDGLSVVMSDDDSTSHYQSSKSAEETRRSNPNTGESGGSSDARETTKMLQQDWKIRMFRYVTIALLVTTGVVLSVATYVDMKHSEKREFETSFYFQASQLDQATGAELEAKLHALDTLSVAATSFSRSAISPNETTWPYITLAHFPHLAASTLNMAKGMSLFLIPIVRRGSLVEWQDYSVQAQGWMAKSLEFQAAHPEAFLAENSDVFEKINHEKDISEFVFEVDNGIPTKVKERDIVLPIWQHAPLRTGLPWVNYDASSDKESASAVREVIETQSSVLGKIFELADSVLGYEDYI